MSAVVLIDDPADPRVADFAGLRGQWRVSRPDYFVAEGVWVIERLLASPYPLRSVLLTERALDELGDRLPDHLTVCVAPEDLLRDVAGFDFHRGALASAGRLPLPEPAALLDGARFVLAVEGVNDHENLGALFRNAAAFGVDAVILDGTTCDPLYRRSIRVSMGHALRLPFTRVGDFGALGAAGFDVLALTPSAPAEIEDVDRRERQAVLVGAEGPGLSKAAMAACDRAARIPMAPGVDSLNVATVAAVALYRLCGSKLNA